MSYEQRKQLELAKTYASMHRFKESEQLYNKIISEDEGCYEAYLNLASLYSDFNYNKEATEIALIAREYFGADELINQFIYFDYKRSFDYVNAEMIVLETLELEPNSAAWYIRYAELLITTGAGTKERVNALIKQALALDSNDDIVLYTCVYLTILNVDVLVDMKKLLEDYITNFNNSFYKYKLLGLRAYKLKHYQEAYEYYLQALQIRPQNTQLAKMLTVLKWEKSWVFSLRRFVNQIGGLHVMVSLIFGLSVITRLINLNIVTMSLWLFGFTLVSYWIATFKIMTGELIRDYSEEE
jgi:tetratricopeptide (TPR) repeat protein